MAEPRDQTIRDASQTLLDLLRTNLPDVTIDLRSPKDPLANRLTLFLYKVLENPDLKNADNLPDRLNNDGSLTQTTKPLIVDLYYILTAHSAGENGVLEAYRALSRAMRVFYDNGVIRGSLLRTLDPNRGFTADSFLRITLNPISMEDMTRIWSVFPDTPYELSVTYLVTPVAIESTRTLGTAPVVDEKLEHGHRGAELQA